MHYDVVIAGGGPAGLAAALTLGRARKRVLLCDAGPPRNAAAVHVYNFVTRDGVTPAEFRRVGREQLEPYSGVETRNVHVEEIRGVCDEFEVRLTMGSVHARRILLCTGMIDELPDIDGFSGLWGKAIFACPYCHAWEIQDRRFGYLAAKVDALSSGLLLRGWTSDVVVLTDGKFDVPAETSALLAGSGVRLEERPIVRLVQRGEHLDRIDFDDGAPLHCDALFAHPRQRQVELVRSLGLALDQAGYVQVDDVRRETSIPGIYAGGDLVTPSQSAINAAASGTQAAGKLNHALTVERATKGALL